MSATLVLAACGGSDADGGGGGDTTDGDGGDAATETGPGVTDDTITLGMLNDLTGPTVAIGEPLELGIRAALDVINDDGGIAGRQVELIVEDHGFNPQTAVQKYRGMHEDVLALVTVEGEPNTAAVREQAREDDVFFWPGTFTSEYAFSVYTPVATTYYHEALNAVDFIVDELDGEGATIGAFALESGIGRDYERVMADLEDLYDVTAGPLIKHAASDTDYSGQVQQMIDADVDFVLVGTAPRQAAAILSTTASQGLDVPAVMAAVAYSPTLVEGATGDVLTSRAYVASPWAAWDADEQGQQRLREAVDDATPDLNIQTGWTMMMALADIIEAAADEGQLNRQGILDAIAALEEVDVGGVVPPISLGEGEDGRYISTLQSRIYSITDDGLSLEREAFAGEGTEEAELEAPEQ